MSAFEVSANDKPYRDACRRHVVIGNRADCPDCQSMPLRTLEEHGRIAAEKSAVRVQHLQRVKARMKSVKLSGAYLAWSLGKSSSFINECLRGNYPHSGAGFLPKYLEDDLRGRGLWND